MKLTIQQVIPSARTLRKSIILAAGLLISAQAVAASQCKGLENSACDAKAFCGWVQAYERKDGIKVKAFCRTKSKGAAKKIQKN